MARERHKKSPTEVELLNIDERVIIYSPKYETVLESPSTVTLVKLYFAKFFVYLKKNLNKIYSSRDVLSLNLVQVIARSIFSL